MRLLSILGFVVVAGSAIVGIVTNNDRIFVAQNIAIDVLFAALFAGNVVIGRPIIGLIAREAVPAIQGVMPLTDPVFVRLTLLNAALQIAQASIRLVLLGAVDANTYAIASRVIAMPMTFVFIVYCYRAIGRRAIAIWPADLAPPSRVGEQ